MNFISSITEIAQFYAGHRIVYSGEFFKMSSSDVVNDICVHIGMKNLDVEPNCRSVPLLMSFCR